MDVALLGTTFLTGTAIIAGYYVLRALHSNMIPFLPFVFIGDLFEDLLYRVEYSLRRSCTDP